MSFPEQHQTYISVDVETAGPAAGVHALLSIGACTLTSPPQTFYVELQPDREASLPDALEISGLSLAHLARNGLPPVEALNRFADWLTLVVPAEEKPVFLALNAPFDWSFINHYFHRYLGHNPFGHSALDMKALYMGLTGVSWNETYFEAQARHFGLDIVLTHHALQDALDQARLFRCLLQEHAQRLNK